ncbi:hypothetical protein Z043_125672, partial [Scleropages formosus]
MNQCELTEDCCETLTSVLTSNSSHLKKLSGCCVTEQGCSFLASALCSNPCSYLRRLDLSYNKLQDSGVEILSMLLNHQHCNLQILRLSGCGVTDGGCDSLASALDLNPCSHLRELDLNSFQLTLDPNTANRHLYLPSGNREVTGGAEELHPHPDHPERFDCYRQVLCKESLSGRCYWEVQWGGDGAEIGVTYKGIQRKGGSDDCRLGYNDKSWILCCSHKKCFVRHNKKDTDIPVPTPHRVGVYV